MGLNEIKIKILDDARVEAEKISQKAREELKTIEETAIKDAAGIRDMILADAEADAEEVKRSILTPARLAAKKRILEEKHKILDEAFSGASPKIIEEKTIEVAKWLNLHTR